MQIYGDMSGERLWDPFWLHVNLCIWAEMLYGSADLEAYGNVACDYSAYMLNTGSHRMLVRGIAAA